MNAKREEEGNEIANGTRTKEVTNANRLSKRFEQSNRIEEGMNAERNETTCRNEEISLRQWLSRLKKQDQSERIGSQCRLPRLKNRKRKKRSAMNRRKKLSQLKIIK